MINRGISGPFRYWHHPHHVQQYAANRLQTALHQAYPDLPLIVGCESPEEFHRVIQTAPPIATLESMCDGHRRFTAQGFLEHAHYFGDVPRGGNKFSPNAGLCERVQQLQMTPWRNGGTISYRSGPRHLWKKRMLGVSVSAANDDGVVRLGQRRQLRVPARVKLDGGKNIRRSL